MSIYEELIKNIMIHEALTGDEVLFVIMSVEYFNKVYQSDSQFIRAEGVIAGGVPYLTDEEQLEDYILYT